MGVHKEGFDDNIKMNNGATRKVQGSNKRKDKKAPKESIDQKDRTVPRKYEVNRKTIR